MGILKVSNMNSNAIWTATRNYFSYQLISFFVNHLVYKMSLFSFHFLHLPHSLCLSCRSPDHAPTHTWSTSSTPAYIPPLSSTSCQILFAWQAYKSSSLCYAFLSVC